MTTLTRRLPDILPMKQPTNALHQLAAMTDAQLADAAQQLRADFLERCQLGEIDEEAMADHTRQRQAVNDEVVRRRLEANRPRLHQS
jgi:hypothetical protein